MYSIGKFGTMVGLATSTLRYYEKEGLLPYVSRDSNGRRQYTEKQVEWIKLVMSLKETGMTIEEIKKYTDLVSAGNNTRQERRDLLLTHKKKVEKQVVQTEQYLERITRKIAYYEASVLGQKPS